MTERDLRKLNHKELLELLEEQEKAYGQARKCIDQLRQENIELMESLSRVAEGLEQQRAREESAGTALAERDAENRRLSLELEGVREGKARLEEQVLEIAEKFGRLKAVLLEKEQKLRAAEKTIAEQERTIRSLQERGTTGPQTPGV